MTLCFCGGTHMSNRKILAVILSLTMVFGSLPMTVLAGEEADIGIAEEDLPEPEGGEDQGPEEDPAAAAAAAQAPAEEAAEQAAAEAQAAAEEAAEQAAAEAQAQAEEQAAKEAEAQAAAGAQAGVEPKAGEDPQPGADDQSGEDAHAGEQAADPKEDGESGGADAGEGGDSGEGGYAVGGDAGDENGSSITYISRTWDGTKVVSTDETADSSIQPFPADGNITSGWYYLDSDVTKDGRIESITGDVNLILGDGYTLDVKGLYVPQGTTLSIYAQSDSEDAGTLYSRPSSGGAAIGGKSGSNNGNITIYGGNIIAEGDDNCAGIGTNDGKRGGAIIIYGGTITAEGGKDGAAIGGGRNRDGGDITIYGGDITANSPDDSNCPEDGAGIGGGRSGDGGMIGIYGGTITTYSRDGAGIGGGDDGAAGDIFISGGTITSTKVNQGQGARIGSGCDGSGGTITINGGTITTSGGSGAGIGGGKGNVGVTTITITGGDITCTGSYGIGNGSESSAYTPVTLDYTNDTKDSISINASSFNGNVTLEMPFGRYIDGELVQSLTAGEVEDNSTLSGGVLKAPNGQIDSPVTYTQYSRSDAGATVGTENTTEVYTEVTSDIMDNYPDGLTTGDYVVKSSIKINDHVYVKKGCTVNLIIINGKTVNFKQGLGCGLKKNGRTEYLQRPDRE